MCGLAGFWDPSLGWDAQALNEHARRMAGTLARRGPDDSGSWADAEVGIALGFQRLAIIDLTSEGGQPMISASGRYVLIFNGEIYNHPELRTELESRSARFRGHSDTEVVLNAIELWGLEQSLQRFVGMFAFALWDRTERVLRLGRDRFGEKPLYYGRAGRSLVFGSELKALRAHPHFKATVNRLALARFMRYGYVPGPETIYEQVWKLPPGTTLRADSSQGSLAEPAPYWSVRETVETGLGDPFRGTEQDATVCLEELLRNAVRGQMIADVPLGAFLSGGIDSSTMVALMQAESSRPIRTFTIGFHETEFNEAEHAKAVARHLGTDHTEYYLSPAESLAVVPKLADLYDEPFADSSSIPTFLVSQLAARDVTVCISGDGGDELFAGYSWYPWAMKTWRSIARVPRVLRRVTSGVLQKTPEVSWDTLFRSLGPLLPAPKRALLSGRNVHRYADLLSRCECPEDVLMDSQTYWRQAVVLGADGESSGSDKPRPRYIDGSWRADPLSRMMVQDMLAYLPDDILVKVDRASMGVSLETRAPFLDHRIVEFVARLPNDWKWREGRSKYILRRVLERFVPSTLVERPKAGFRVPVGAWLRGPLREWAEDLLTPEAVKRAGFLDPSLVQHAWRTHQSGEVDLGQQVWTLLMFQAWNQTWIENKAVPVGSAA